MDVTREQLRVLVDAIPDERLDEAAQVIRELTIPIDDEPVTEEDREALNETHEEYLRGELIPHDEVVRAIGGHTISVEDEPVTEEDLEAIREGREEYRRGETVPHEQAMRELGL